MSKTAPVPDPFAQRQRAGLTQVTLYQHLFYNLLPNFSRVFSEKEGGKIIRPRQLYVGNPKTDYIEMEKR